jgi:hypothetical protein
MAKLIDNPISRTALFAGGGLLGGHLLTKYLGSQLVDMLFADKDEQERNEIVNKYKEGGRYSYALPILGALAGTVLAQGGNVDFSQGLFNRAVLQSMTDQNYWNNNPDRFAKRVQDMKKPTFLDKIFLKEHSLQDTLYNKATIPVTGSVNLFSQDNFLSQQEKDSLVNLMSASNNYSPGIVSQKKLTSSLIDSGIGFGTAYLFGKGVGTLLGLPSEITHRLSSMGGIANAVQRSGLFG